MAFPIIGPAGAGDVSGPGSATDNALARFNGTGGKTLQNSVAILSDAGALSGLTGFSSSGNVDVTNGSNAEFWRFISSTGDLTLTGGGASMTVRVPLSSSLSGSDKVFEVPPISGLAIADTSGTGAPASSAADGTMGEFRRVAGFAYYCHTTGSGVGDRWVRWAVTTSF